MRTTVCSAPANDAQAAPAEEAIREHLLELPLMRRGILAAVCEFSSALPAGTRVLDAGAGNAPYAGLFAHCRYVTVDWENSIYERAARADIIASLDSLPVADASFDAVLCTEVLEHVRDPGAVLAELSRVLVPKGRLCLTVPFVWPLHEEPFDFFRYTPYALHDLLERHAFSEVTIEPTAGFLSTLAQVAEILLWTQRESGARRRAKARNRRSQLTTELRERATLRLLRLWSASLVSIARRSTLQNALTGVELPLGFRAAATKVGTE